MNDFFLFSVYILMSLSSTTSLIGVSVLVFYSVSKILQFYGIGENVYGVYMLFYIFIIALIMLIPNNYPDIV